MAKNISILVTFSNITMIRELTAQKNIYKMCD